MAERDALLLVQCFQELFQGRGEGILGSGSGGCCSARATASAGAGAAASGMRIQYEHFLLRLQGFQHESQRGRDPGKG